MVLTRNPKIIIMLSLMVLPSALYADQFQVIRVTDGDTIAAVSNGKEITVNLVGIDAPELPMEKAIGIWELRDQYFGLEGDVWIGRLTGDLLHPTGMPVG